MGALRRVGGSRQSCLSVGVSLKRGQLLGGLIRGIWWFECSSHARFAAPSQTVVARCPRSTLGHCFTCGVSRTTGRGLHVQPTNSKWLGVIRSIIKWGVGMEIVGPEVLVRLQAGSAVSPRDSRVRKPKDVKPVEECVVQETLAFASQQVRAMEVPRHLLVAGKRFDDLLCGPLVGGVLRDVHVENSSAIVREDNEAVDGLESQRRHHEEVAGCGDRLRVWGSRSGSRHDRST